MKTAKSSLIIITALLCVFQGLYAQNSKNNPSRWEKDIADFEKWDMKNSWPKDALLFVGSSSIRMWNTRDSFPLFPVINRGFGGCQTSDVNYYTDRIVLKYKPEIIIFYCGDNDISSGKTPRTVLNDYKIFVNKVHEKLPDTRIIYISIKASGKRWDLWPVMNTANKMIAEFSAKSDLLYYADCASPLIKDEQPDNSLFLGDHLHLNSEGYKKWVKVLKPIIEKAKKKALRQ